MGEIEQSSQRIAEIVGVIDEIAFQTNLLALNAAVEAARAGDAGPRLRGGRGEVRSLAQRSSQASKEIKGLISTSNSHVKQGVELVSKAGGTLGEIVTSVKKVADIVSEIAAASQEQSAVARCRRRSVHRGGDAEERGAGRGVDGGARLDRQSASGRHRRDLVLPVRGSREAEPANAHAPARAGVRRPPAKRLPATGTDDD